MVDFDDAVTAGADALVGVPDEVLADTTAASRGQRFGAARAVLAAAVDAGVFVGRDRFEDTDRQLRQAELRFDRVQVELAEVGGKRLELERVCHLLADALQTGQGAEAALAAYRNVRW